VRIVSRFGERGFRDDLSSCMSSVDTRTPRLVGNGGFSEIANCCSD